MKIALIGDHDEMVTAYHPERSAFKNKPHRLISAFLAAAL
jgi:hypothetical protein